ARRLRGRCSLPLRPGGRASRAATSARDCAGLRRQRSALAAIRTFVLLRSWCDALGGRARTELVPAAPATVPRYRADQCCAGATTGGPAAEPAIGRSGTQS